MIEDILQLQPIIYALIGFLLVCYTLKKIAQVLQARYQTDVRMNRKRPSDSLPPTLDDALDQMSHAASSQLSLIESKCKEAGIDPSKDVGYLTVKDQIASLNGEKPVDLWGLKLNVREPFTHLILEAAYSFGRSHINDLSGSVNKVLKSFGR